MQTPPKAQKTTHGAEYKNTFVVSAVKVLRYYEAKSSHNSADKDSGTNAYQRTREQGNKERYFTMYDFTCTATIPPDKA